METINDPLAILVVPHSVVEWMKNRSLLMKKYFPRILKEQRENGKFAVFHNTTRLTKLFNTEEEARNRIDEIVGDKRNCIANMRVFSVKQL